jgi:hypothetical protein
MITRAGRYSIVAEDEHIEGNKAFRDQHAKPARNMIIATARSSCVCGDLTGSSQVVGWRQRCQSFQHLGNVGIRNPVIDMPSAPHRRSQTGQFKLLKMRTRSLRADLGRASQLLVGESTPVHQLAQDAVTAGIGERGPYDVKSWFDCHSNAE